MKGKVKWSKRVWWTAITHLMMSKFCSFWVFFTPFPFAKEFFIALHWHIFDKSCYPSLLSFCLSLSFPPFSFFPSLFLSSSSLFYTLPLSPFSSPFRSLFPKHVLSSLSSSNWFSFYPYARRNVFRELERKRNHSILIIYPLPQRERFGFLQFAFNLAHFSSGILELESTPNDNAMSISQFFLYFTVLFHITRSNAQFVRLTSRNTQKTHKEIWKFTCKLSVRDTCLFCYKGKSIHFPLIFYILSDCCYYYCCCSGRRKYNHNKCTMCVVCTVIGIVSEFVFFILWSRASGVISDMVSLCELNEKSKVRKTHRLNGTAHVPSAYYLDEQQHGIVCLQFAYNTHLQFQLHSNATMHFRWWVLCIILTLYAHNRLDCILIQFN